MGLGFQLDFDSSHALNEGSQLAVPERLANPSRRLRSEEKVINQSRNQNVYVHDIFLAATLNE